MGLYKRKIVVDDKAIGEGAGLTLKQSLLPCFLGMTINTREAERRRLIVRSYYTFLPLGFRLWAARRPELAFSEGA
jgi:hypothetical protein